MFVMIDNKITQITKQSGRKLTLLDGSTCDVTQVRYIWKDRVPYPNKYYLNAHIMREIFTELQYKETK